MINNTDEVMYALYYKPKDMLLTWFLESNEDRDFCNDNTYTLCTNNYHGNGPWMTKDPYMAEWVRCFDTPWYNSCYDTPQNPFHSYDVQVIKVKIKKEYEEVDISIPTPYEYYKWKYEKRSPDYWEGIKNCPPDSYDIYDLKEYNKKHGK